MELLVPPSVENIHEQQDVRLLVEVGTWNEMILPPLS